MSTKGRPLQLILARNLLASLHTPAFIIDAPGQIAFYNDAAAAVLGRRFEESGPLSVEEWTATFGPFGEDGTPLSYHEIGLTRAAFGNRAAHERMRIRSVQGTEHEIEASVLPIVGEDGFHGAMVFFWTVGEGEP